MIFYMSGKYGRFFDIYKIILSLKNSSRMKKMLPCLLVIAGLNSCQKEAVKTSTADDPSRLVTDTLMVYQSTATNGNPCIYSMRFKTGETQLLVLNAAQPYATNERMVYIKSGKTLGYGRLNGISKLIADLNAPLNPCLSVDSRLISVVDQVGATYQLLLLDTLGNKTSLYQSNDELSFPCFTNDGQQIVFAQKALNNSSAIFIIDVAGGVPRLLSAAVDNVLKNSCTVLDQRAYFLQTEMINGKSSTEICSVNLDATGSLQNTNFTANWTQPSFEIEQLRKINNSSVIFISTYGSTNREIFTAKTSNLSNHERLTYSGASESFPNLIPAYDPLNQ